MSTNTNTTSAAWQSDRAREFRERTEGKLAAHWGEITRHLAPPVIAWRWGESGLSQAMKCYLRDKGLIERDPSGDRWMTSMCLWSYVIEKAGEDEPVGTDATGQETLAVPDAPSRPTRVLTDTTTARPLSREQQSTLTGGVIDTADTDTGEEIRKPWRKDPTSSKPTPKELAASHPTQAKLSTWTTEDGIVTDRWDVSIDTDAGVRVPY